MVTTKTPVKRAPNIFNQRGGLLNKIDHLIFLQKIYMFVLSGFTGFQKNMLWCDADSISNIVVNMTK